jgi:hypothetical protein
MKDARTLLLEVLAAIPDGKRVASLFAEDGVVELPFLHAIGLEPRYEGRRAIAEYYEFVRRFYPDFAFWPEDTHVLIETPDQVYAEYTAHATSATMGRRIHHLFVARLVAENGRIKLLREALNVVAAAQAFLPGGVADLPRPEAEIFSYKPGYRS